MVFDRHGVLDIINHLFDFSDLSRVISFRGNPLQHHLPKMVEFTDVPTVVLEPVLPVLDKRIPCVAIATVSNKDISECLCRPVDYIAKCIRLR